MKTKMSNALRAKLDAAIRTDEFWMESAKLDFALALEHQRKRIGKSYADVAAAIETSPAYISKVFRGDANLTIESMVKLVRSLGCNFDFKLKEIVEDEVVSAFRIQTTNAPINRSAYAAFIAEKDGVQAGRFNLLNNVTQSTNDHIYQDAA